MAAIFSDTIRKVRAGEAQRQPASSCVQRTAVLSKGQLAASQSTAADFSASDSSRSERGGTEAVELSFSTDQNPYLYPLTLLDPLALLDSLANKDQHSNSDSFETLDSSDRESCWWLLHTKPRQEKKLAEQLAAYDIAHYLPTTKCRAVTRGRTRVTEQPLFHGYFFLRGTPDERLRALETNRLVAAHRVDDNQGLSERLWELAKLIEIGAPLTAEARLAVGRKVRVKSGVFSGMEGTVAMRGGKTRLFILVNELLGGVSLEIEEHCLEPIL